MGGFLLVHHDRKTIDAGRAAKVALARDLLSRKGLPTGPILSEEQFTLYLFGKSAVSVENLVRSQTGWAAAVGTLFYRGYGGADALRSLLADAATATLDWTAFAGNYCVLLYRDGRLTLASDVTGLYPIYCDETKSVLSSSLLAVSAMQDRRTPNLQEIREFVFGAAFYGEDTPLVEVKRLDPASKWHWTPDLQREPQAIPGDDILRGKCFDDAVQVAADALKRYFGTVARTFESEISSALSGGYDSRLVLALLLEAGAKPYLYVYGASHDPDVKVAKRVAASRSLPLHHVDRGQRAPLDPHEFADRLRADYAFFDGTGHEIGVFDDGRDLDSRRERAGRVRLQLNGGGGEIYRNFWMLRRWPVGVRDLVTTHFDAGDFRICRASFNRGEYVARLVEKARNLVPGQGRRETREDIELLYPWMRLRYWQAKNNVFNNQLTFALTPFAEAQFAIPASALPMSMKEHGRFEAALIATVDRGLAAQPSVYGHDFLTAPSRRARMDTAIQQATPAAFVAWAKRRRARRRAADPTRRPYWFANQYLEPIFGPGERMIDNWFDLGSTNDPGVLGRALTMELLLRGAGL